MNKVQLSLIFYCDKCKLRNDHVIVITPDMEPVQNINVECRECKQNDILEIEQLIYKDIVEGDK